MTIHIHNPQPDMKRIFTRHCPDCERHSWFVSLHTPFYGWDTTCLRCGRNWKDGQWMRLPFVPQARQKSIEDAKRWFRNTAVSEEEA